MLHLSLATDCGKGFAENQVIARELRRRSGMCSLSQRQQARSRPQSHISCNSQTRLSLFCCGHHLDCSRFCSFNMMSLTLSLSLLLCKDDACATGATHAFLTMTSAVRKHTQARASERHLFHLRKRACVRNSFIRSKERRHEVSYTTLFTSIRCHHAACCTNQCLLLVKQQRVYPAATLVVHLSTHCLLFLLYAKKRRGRERQAACSG